MTVVPKGFLTQEALAMIRVKAKEVQERLRQLRSQRATSVETWSTTQPPAPEPPNASPVWYKL